MSDSELLKAYVEEGDESAFGELVRRHQDMVYSSCLRRLGDSARAEDAAQQTFLRLAAKSAGLVTHASLGGWLYKTALGEAANLHRKEYRRLAMEDSFRKKIEHDASNQAVPREAAAASLVPELDDAMLALRDSDREALVLRFFQNRSLREVGEALGTTEEAARKRVSRAIDQLTQWFRVRGLATGSAAVATGLVTSALSVSTQAAPASLAPSIVAGAKSTLISVHTASTAAAAKLKMAAAALAIGASVPVAMQWKANSDLRAKNSALEARLDQLTQAVASVPRDGMATASAMTPSPMANGPEDADNRNKEDKRRFDDWRKKSEKESLVRLQARVEQMRERLQLTDHQVQAASLLLEQARQQRQEIRDKFVKGHRPSFEDEQVLARSVYEADRKLSELLSHEQKQELNVVQEEERRDRVEESANRQLSSWQQVLRLSEEQKDSVFSLLLQHSVATDVPSLPPVSSEEEWKLRQDNARAALNTEVEKLLTPTQLKSWQSVNLSRPWMGF